MTSFTYRHRRSGFTLVEALAAALILAGAVVALCSISTRSLSAAALNRQYEQACTVLDRQLTMLQSLGVATLLEEPVKEGVADEGGREFTWTLQLRQQELTGLYRVDAKVQWLYKDRPRTVTTAALFYNDTTTLATLE